MGPGVLESLVASQVWAPKAQTPTPAPRHELPHSKCKLTSCQVKTVSSSLPPRCRKMSVVLGFWQKLLQAGVGEDGAGRREGAERGLWVHWHANQL